MRLEPNSKSLREFSLKATTNAGKSIVIHYCYDMSSKHSGYRVSASIDGNPPSSEPKMMKIVKSLHIPAITNLIGMMGRDVTGAPYSYDKEAEQMASVYVENERPKDWNRLKVFHGIRTDTEGEKLADFLEKFIKASVRARKGLVKRYNDGRRIILIEMAREAIRGLRELYMNGVMVKGETCVVRYEGLLKERNYPLHYKRDIDYIRKARVNLFKRLGKKYVPFK